MKGRKRQILVDANGFLVTCRVEPAGMSDRKAARFLTAGLAPLWPRLRTIIADAGCESGALAQHLEDQAGWPLCIIKRPRPGFEIVGPNWIVERSFACLGRHRRLSKDYEFRVRSSEALITVAACALMMKRLAPSLFPTHPLMSTTSYVGKNRLLGASDHGASERPDAMKMVAQAGSAVKKWSLP